ncbi:hypothetical protein [Halalkalibacter wakoensis]|uniref:hypothetical protein n=1 Tax=Halalkalibacter wakoensis TaxID=127891 RepID=UPI000558D59B|nr:hypothetical protein [Halalkalibacter wakoensis]
MYGPQQPTVQFLPPTVVTQYVNQWVTTSIPNYGEVTAYITDYNRRTGMVSLFIYRAPSFQPQFLQVHHSDLVGIAPYYGLSPLDLEDHQDLDHHITQASLVVATIRDILVADFGHGFLNKQVFSVPVKMKKACFLSKQNLFQDQRCYQS